MKENLSKSKIGEINASDKSSPEIKRPFYYASLRKIVENFMDNDDAMEELMKEMNREPNAEVLKGFKDG